MSRSILLVCRQAPYSGSLARAGLDLALAMAAFDQPVALLFCDEGVLQLLPGQDTTELGARNLGKTLASLPLYGVETLYVDSHSLEKFGISQDSRAFLCFHEPGNRRKQGVSVQCRDFGGRVDTAGDQNLHIMPT